MFSILFLESTNPDLLRMNLQLKWGNLISYIVKLRVFYLSSFDKGVKRDSRNPLIIVKEKIISANPRNV